jgi:HEAT repeat protein
MPASDAMQWLSPAIASPDADVRRQAAEALGGLKGAEAIAAATKLVADSEPEVQREAIEALGQLLQSSDAQAAKAALPVLQKALQHDDPKVRRQLVETLGSLRAIADEVVPLLARAVEDRDPGVQKQAVESLGRISSADGFEDWAEDFVQNHSWQDGGLGRSMEELKQSLEELEASPELEAPKKAAGTELE